MARHPILCLLGLALVSLVAGQRVHAQTNLITNGSFEAGAWGGTDSFVNSNNASNLLFWNTQVASWIPDSNSTWVQDPTRASDQNRMVWLGPPGAPYNQPITYIAQTVSVAGLTAGQSYHLALDYDFLDPTDPNGLAAMNSTMQVYYMLGNAMDMGGGNFMLMDDTNTKTGLLSEMGMTGSWNNAGGLQWTQDGVDFTMPGLSSYDYLRIFIAAPPNGGATPSMGVLVDNVSLVAVPEPGSLLLTSMGLLGVLSLRRRR
jgi:hypothetical protein